MDFQSIAKLSPKAYLPEELCRDILSRLPVKSLLRFCCVSKSWLSLIRDPDFHRLHLQNFKNNQDETHLLVVERRSKDCFVRCNNTLEKATGPLLTLGERYGNESWSFKCFLDGLVLLEGSEGRLRIWNPSIRKFHDIPRSPKIETFHDSQERVIGLAYDALVEDYKCVKIIHGNSNQPPLVAVYTLGAGSWKIIPFQVKEGGSHYASNFKSIRCWETVYLEGNLYFLVDHVEGKVLELGWFDVSREVFCSINLPWAWDDTHWLATPIRLVRKGCSSLALTHFDEDEDKLTIWVFESKAMCWTDECYESFVVPEHFYLKKNGCDVLIWGRDDEDVYYVKTPAGQSLTVFLRVISSYNLETKQEKILLIQSNKDNEMPELVFGYIESLVLLK